MQWLRWLPRFREAYRALPILEERESWPRDRIEAMQLSRINGLWEHAIRHVPYYQALHQRESLPKQFVSLQEFSELVPPLSKSVVRREGDAFLSTSRKPGGKSCTSGSTGSPMTFYWAHEDHREVLRARYRFYQSWGVDVLDRTAFLWGAELQKRYWWQNALKLARQTTTDRLRSRMRLLAYDLNSDKLRRNLDQIAAYQPVMLYGFSHALYLLAREALEVGFSCDSLRLVVHTSEIATPRMIQTIRQAFSADVVSEYGATECGFIAGQAPDGTLRVREDVAMVETVSHGEGRHDILLTVLGNSSFPLLRYAIEDLSDGPLQKPEQGFAILPNIAGRADDVAYSSSGQQIHPARIHAVFERLHHAIRRYQVQQAADGNVDVVIELAGESGGSNVPQLQARLIRLFGEFAVQIETVSQIKETTARKHRVVASDYRTGSNAL